MLDARTRLKWLCILGPIIYVLVITIFFLTEHTHTGDQWAHNIAMTLGLGVIGVVPFSFFVFNRVRIQEVEVVRRSDAMATLATVSRSIVGIYELDEILRFLLEETKELLKADAVVLSLVNDQNILVPRIQLGPPEIFSDKSPTDAALSPQTKNLPVRLGYSKTTKDDFECLGIKDGSMKVLSKAPLLKDGKIVGLLGVGRISRGHFSSIDLEVLNDLAALTVVALENADLQSKVKDMALAMEHRRIARDMHDGLAQNLALLDIQLERIEQKLRSQQVAESMEILKEIRLIARQSHKDLRRDIQSFRGQALDGNGATGTLMEYLSRLDGNPYSGMKLSVRGDKSLQFEPAVEVQLLRIVQEAIANVRKHSKAGHSQISVSQEGKVARIVIQDDGVGFDMGSEPQADGSFGLEIMRERAEEIGAELLVNSKRGQGTTVEVRMPLSLEGK